jgi:glycosyltransferase involved in cell wall biosynthesis
VAKSSSVTSRILVATDAWRPQVNGVVRTLETTAATLRNRGHEVLVVEPSLFPNRPAPFYPEISVCLPLPGRVEPMVKRFRPDHVHIATEGPIGLAIRRVCRRFGWRFTTSYHTKFPEYLKAMLGVPESWTYWHMRRFHDSAARVLVATPSLEAELGRRGFRGPFHRWSRGVDLTLFQPRPKTAGDFPRPILLYAGRVSTEKNLEAFLKLDTPGTKVIVGDGPARATLEASYPAAKFLGYRRGAELAAVYAEADLFVFPSKTDTFGIVLIEAMACGLPVAAYPVTGPIDIVTRPELGALHDDLGVAIHTALANGRSEACVAEARTYTWDRCTDQFAAGLVTVS